MILARGQGGGRDATFPSWLGVGRGEVGCGQGEMGMGANLVSYGL